jgi:hypothetical protein
VSETSDRTANEVSTVGDLQLQLRASPHLKAPDSTPKIMWNVVGSLVPVIAAATWFFGPSALLVITAATAGAVLTERAFGQAGSLGDGSAAITGLLLGLTLPPGLGFRSGSPSSAARSGSASASSCSADWARTSSTRPCSAGRSSRRRSRRR